MSDRNLVREQKGHVFKDKIDNFIIDPSKETMCLLDDAYNQLKRTYPQCELAEKYHGKDCKVSIDGWYKFNAHIVRDGIWAVIEFHGAQITYSWEAVDHVMKKGGVFKI